MEGTPLLRQMEKLHTFRAVLEKANNVNTAALDKHLPGDVVLHYI